MFPIAWAELLRRLTNEQQEMEPDLFRDHLIGCIGALLNNIPEDYWFKMEEIEACGRIDCNCHETSRAAMQAFNSIRKEFAALMGTEKKAQPSITCPMCGRTSYNLNDIKEKYCGWCHAWHCTKPHIS